MRVFSVPVSAPFLRTVIAALVDGRLVDGFEARTNPEKLAQATLYLPTRRAGRMAREIFLDELKTDAVLLPRIVALGDIDEDELAFAQAASESGLSTLDIPPAMEGLQRRLLLAQLIAAWARRIRPGDPAQAPLVVGGPASTLALADDLARLMDDMVTRGVEWRALEGLVPDALDQYWQLTLQFLNIAKDAWPNILTAHGKIEPAARRDRLIEAEARRLGEHHAGPVIAAGSTGSMPATAKFLQAVADLAQGAVVLPGLDTDLDDDAWQSIGGVSDAQGKFTTPPASNHPQFAMHALLRRLGIKRGDVDILGAPAPQGRDMLVSEAMRPSNATAQWHRRLAEPEIAGKISGGMKNLAVIEADNPEMEALAIAVAMREARHLNKSAALVTPDRALARRVTAALGRWNLAFDDSGGDALMDTSAGIFARLAAEAAAKQLEPPTLLALLKHPLLRLGGAQGAFKGAVETLEMALLRGTRPQAGSDGLAQDFSRFRTELAKLRNGETSSLHYSEPRTKLKDKEFDQARGLIASLHTALAPLESLAASKPHDLAELAERHRNVLIELSRDEHGVPEIFEGQQGSALASAFDDLLGEGSPSGLMVELGDYPEVFQTTFGDRIVRRPESANAQLHIYGQLEARLTQSDRVILGGLVEGVWPPAPRIDPWLSRPMRHELGLDLPERRIGLSAHDFVQLLGTGDVILSHAAKAGGAPTVASRFLHRLEAVAGEAHWETAKAAGKKYVRSLHRRTGRPNKVKPIPQPAPKPPRATRPQRLSVTAIEDWLRDPYTIYANISSTGSRSIPSTCHCRPPIAVRRSMKRSASSPRISRETFPPIRSAYCASIGARYFAPLMERPEARALWWPRFQRIAQWFSEWEAARRGDMSLRSRPRSRARSRSRSIMGANSSSPRAPTASSAAPTAVSSSSTTRPVHPPTGKQVRMGLSPQLTLEAAILREGGFEGIDAGTSVGELVYVRLSGNNPPGEHGRWN